jgi:phosphoribosylaminoimidazole carboxylase PurK protein
MKNRIGIVGGGQLARMLTIAAKQLGFVVTVLDPTPNAPAGQVADAQIVGDLNNETAMMQLATHSDFLTLEWELANPYLLGKIAQKGIPVNPSAKTLEIIKDKYEQKLFLQKAGIPVADFVEVKTKHDIEHAGEKFGYPLLLKAKIGAYDGRGNFLIKTKQDIAKGLEKLGSTNLYVEKFVPFEKELAIMVARNTNGEIVTYPVVETIHKNNILHITLAPAPIEKTLAKKAEMLARKTMQQLKGAGVFGIEMFLTRSASFHSDKSSERAGQAKVLINEIAPRVHNSGHYTIEPCITSQFEQHIRAITGLPLGKTTMLTKAAVMVNILGEHERKATVEGLEKALQLPGVSVHIYGKKETRKERKMGHITAIGDSLEQCLRSAKKARSYLSI